MDADIKEALKRQLRRLDERSKYETVKPHDLAAMSEAMTNMARLLDEVSYAEYPY